MKLVLKFIGRDSWGRPVYEAEGKLYVDVAPLKDHEPDICTKNNNTFNGEPCDSVKAEFVFVPCRDVWD